MAYLQQRELPPGYEPFVAFRESFGFVPNLFRAQTLLPRAIEAEAGIAGSVLLKTAGLSRIQKEAILLRVAAELRNTYCVAAHSRLLRDLGVTAEQIEQILVDHRSAGLSGPDVALLDYVLTLHHHPTWIGGDDVGRLRRLGFSDEQILEADLAAALTEFLCTLSTGLGVSPDFEPGRLSGNGSGGRAAAAGPEGGGRAGVGHADGRHFQAGCGPYLQAVERSPEDFPPFAFFKKSFGFIPKIFRAQTLRPDVVEAEAAAVGTILLSNDVLSRRRKEYILLAISAANLNTYCVAVHCELLRGLGVPAETSDRVALDHRAAGLPEPDVALLDFALKLAKRPQDFGATDIESLRGHGFGEEQILEAIVMASLTCFLNTLQMGLGTTPDFPPGRVFPAEPVNLPEAGAALMTGAATVAAADTVRVPAAGADEDMGLVARVREGDLGAFEALFRRHHRAVYRTLLGITGRPEDAEDAVQSAFVRAFERLDQFEGAARFSTWLTRIAINEGLSRLKDRGRMESLDASPGEEEPEISPLNLRPWEEDPEILRSRAQTREMVEREILRLPPKYRLAVLLRDIQEMSAEEAAQALGLGVPTLKTHLLRGRLLLREALAPHFARPRREP
jgi:RNA polymerase sigma-70 factor (ECF subfamily)